MARPSGDFTTLARAYAQSRPGYSERVLEALIRFVSAERPVRAVADIGAGTGIFSRMLARHGLDVTAVEPNDAMRREGIATSAGVPIHWHSGRAERTGLPDRCFDWVTVASAFHWVELPAGLIEIHRILRPGGYLTVLWNPRDIDGHPLHERIEAVIEEIVPDLRRVSSGSRRHAADWESVLVSTGHFSDPILFEAPHEERMSRERYMTAWRSVCDIQEQAGPERFEEILRRIAEIVEAHEEIVVPYRTRAWTVRRCS